LRRRPKVAKPTSLFATILIVHDSYFEPTIGILLGRIKGQDLALVMNIPLPPFINKGEFHALSIKKSMCKVGKKSSLSFF
jgi:hypothetical protein